MVQRGIPSCGGSSCVAAIGSDAMGKAMVRVPLENGRREGGSGSRLIRFTHMNFGKWKDATRVCRKMELHRAPVTHPAVFDCRTHHCGWTASSLVA